MPERDSDWFEETRRKLTNSRLTPGEGDEISRELAGYLEDLCSDAASRGLDAHDAAAAEIAATHRAAAELHEDNHLGANLYRARKEGDTMNDRTKQLWFPGLGMFTASAALLAVFQGIAVVVYHAFAPTPAVTGSLSIHARTYPELVRQIMWHDGAALIVYFGWLCMLPFLGALGAYCSRRAGSNRSVQIATGLFPLVLFVGIFVGQHDVGQRGTSLSFLAMDALPPAHIFFVFLPVTLNLLLNWVLIPGAALLAGVLPFVYANARNDRGAALEPQLVE